MAALSQHPRRPLHRPLLPHLHPRPLRLRTPAPLEPLIALCTCPSSLPDRQRLVEDHQVHFERSSWLPLSLRVELRRSSSLSLFLLMLC